MTEAFTGKTLAVGTKYTAFRCPLDLLALAKVRARRERRSLSNYLITLIERDTRAEGLGELNLGTQRGSGLEHKRLDEGDAGHREDD